LYRFRFTKFGTGNEALTKRSYFPNDWLNGSGFLTRAFCWSENALRPSKLSPTNRERWEAVRGAFATLPGSQVDNKRFLLVDDVMATGATLDACAKALREAGATSVAGLTVARAILSPPRVGR
jgi:Phosphoribosyl transferase domain